ncbi:RNA polymerase sigma factor [Caloramator sp. mosi_1]|uniref:RNA polymerase sigma factor n=1 Tax=Caloramator sp. mosi_1 TaxID=3023090 RepID=UPI0023611F91|nr:RNA polymerase sigma factor [Caloramator sp. mosi_1]WDC83382.1 RNA polymerase sigma factor [Caloramator sp. mosi_1]
MNNNFSILTEKEFVEIYQRNVDTVYRICYIYLRNHDDTEDAVQSVFMKLLKNNKKFESSEHEKAWLILTSKNYCKDVLKSWWRKHRISIDDIPEIACWDNSQIACEVLEKLLSLPAKYKEVLYLYYYEGYSIKDISKLLGRNESTIQTQLSTGRKRLKISIGGEYNEKPY